MSAGRQLYVYWRVAAADLAQVLAATRAMQAALGAAHPGLQAQLLQRCGGEREAVEPTLMEIYRHPGAGVTDALQADIERAARCLQRWCRGARHVEVFCVPGGR